MSKKILIIFLAVIVLVNSCSKEINTNLDSKSACGKSGGLWKFFPNTCVDSCSYARSKERIMCGQAFTDGCDCGPNKCWNGKSCEIN